MTIETGTDLTCTNTDCGCRLEVKSPCPHGEGFTCACGHPMEADAGGSGQSQAPVTPGA